MTNKTLIALLLFPIGLQGQATETGPVDRGSMIVGGSASFSRVRGEGGIAITTLSVNPEVLYFTATRLALGGQAGVSRSGSDGTMSTSWMIGPALKYFLGQANAKTLPFLGASFGIGKGTTTGSGATFESSSTTLEGEAGIMWLLASHVALNGEAFAQRQTFVASSSAFPSSDVEQTRFGIRFGITAFVY